MDCRACEVTLPDGPVVEVSARGAFGSVEIVTETQARDGVACSTD